MEITKANELLDIMKIKDFVELDVIFFILATVCFIVDYLTNHKLYVDIFWMALTGSYAITRLYNIYVQSKRH